MSKEPIVSLVVPAFNAADYIGETLESILAQDYGSIEVIVVDDGSSDDTSAIAAGFGERVHLHRQPNAGQSRAMTTGWAMATGEILGYVSADDRLLPQAVSRGVHALSAYPDVVLVYPDFDMIDPSSRRLSTVEPPEFSRHALYGKLHCLPGPGALFRRTAYEKAGPWKSDLRQIPDLDFFLRLALEGDFRRIPAVLAQFRLHPQSTTYRPAPFERGEEPVVMTRDFFARTDLPDDVRGWEKETRAHAHLLSAAIHGRAGRTGLAARHLALAAGLKPSAMLSRKAMGLTLLIARYARGAAAT